MALPIALTTMAGMTIAELSRPRLPVAPRNGMYFQESHVKWPDMPHSMTTPPAWETIGEDNRTYHKNMNPHHPESQRLIHLHLKRMNESQAASSHALQDLAKSQAPEFLHHI